jgi:hypothetical protein
MAGIQVAEANSRKKSPKTLDHLELHPQLGGGHLVKHVYSGYDHEPKEYKFNANGKSQGGEHIVRHLVKHGGLPAMTSADGGNGDETEHEE